MSSFMPFKSALAAVAAAMAGLSTPALAVTDLSDPLWVSGTFVDRVLDTFVVGSTSNIVGGISWAQGSAAFAFGSLVFNQVLEDGQVSAVGLGGYQDQDASLLGFRFEQVAAGTYHLVVSGSTDGVSVMRSAAEISSVPEPESTAMLLAGLGVLGFVMRRRLE